MASFNMQGLEDFARQLEKLGLGADEIAVKAVDEAASIMDAELKSSIQANTQTYGTDPLATSIHHFEPRKNDLGCFTVSTARGKDAKGVRNHDKLYWKEFGNSRQEAQPIVEKCVRRTEEKALKKMQEVFDREANL